ANVAETYAHGAPSGLDPLTVTSQSPIWYQKNQDTEFIDLEGEFHFIVADSGRVGDTKLAVESVRELLKSAPKMIQSKLDRIGTLTHQAKDALEKAGKQLLGKMLDEAQKELEALGVS